MSKQLYEEAIADIKKVKEIAEDNAKRAVIEAVAPRIRELIEKELLNESDYSGLDEESESVSGAPGTPTKPGEMLSDNPNVEDDKEENESKSVSLGELGDVAEAAVEEESSLEEAINNLSLENAPTTAIELTQKLRYVDEMINSLSDVKTHIKETKQYDSSLSQIESMIDSIYGYVQESVSDSTIRLGYNLRLKKCLEKLEKLQEMKMNKRNVLREEDITLELTGLPDDVDLESLGVNLVSGEGEEEAGSEEAPEAPAGDDEDLDLDLDDEEEEGSEDEGEEDESKDKLESKRLGDDVIVEIDENMLRREISRMKALREEDETKAQSWGHGAGDVADDFEDEDMGDPFLDVDLTTEADDKADDDEEEDLDEADMDSMKDEGYDLDEKDMDSMKDEGYDLDEEDMKQAEDDHGNVAPKSMGPGAATSKRGRNIGPDGKVDEADADTKDDVEAKMKTESLRRRMAQELKIQETSRRTARQLKGLYEASSKKAAAAKTLVEQKATNASATKYKAAYAAVAERYNASVTRFNKLSRALTEATQLKNVRSNSNVRPAASTGDVTQLRNKLAETNLLNAKLAFTNKLLQSDSLSSRQKSQVIEQLDSATTLREVKLVYESLAKTLIRTRKPVTEGRVLGSSSQATRSASSQTLNEGHEAERWAKLAGIAK